MRATLLFVIVLVFCVVGKGLAQTVKITQQTQTLAMVFDEVEQQTGMLTLFSNNELDMERVVTLEAREYSLEELYRHVLKGTNLEFEILKNYIVIRPMRHEIEEPASTMYKIKGKVLDKEGIPLPGVTIVMKGSGRGVTTDANGDFQILLPKKEGIILLFSFIGKRMQERVYTGESYLNIVLEDESQEVNEVVITGYQNIPKRHLTSAVTSLDVNKVRLPGVSTIDRMLEGNVPGMIFIQNSGQVGVAPRLRVRGTSSVLGSQEPLWVIDGIIQNDPVNVDASQVNDLDYVNLLGNAISGLNPNDVERIDVLKDASATALYGVRAANGVIVITTKRGRPGRLAVNYNFTGSLTMRSRYADRSIGMMNAAERIDYSREMIEKGLTYPRVSSWVGYEGALKDYYEGKIPFDEFQRQVSFYETNNTDWFDVICRDAFSHTHNLSLSGGTSLFRYYASVGYNRENGILRKEYGDRYTTRLRLEADYKQLDVSFGVTGNVQKKQYTPSEIGLLNYAYNTSRAVPVYNEDGTLWYYPKQGNTYLVNYNVLNERDHSGQTIRGNGFSLLTGVGYRFLRSLRAEIVFAYSRNDTEQRVYFNEETAYMADLRGEMYNGKMARGIVPYGGEIRKDDTESNSYTLRGQLNFNHNIDRSGNHLLVILLGGELNSVKYTGKKQYFWGNLSGNGKLLSRIPVGQYSEYDNWVSGMPEAHGISKHQITNMASLYGSLSYSIRDRYIFNMNARIDASNKFGKEANRKLLPIWSVSGRWNIKDDLLRTFNWVDDFSVRVSYGYQGNMLDLETPEMIIEHGEWDDIMEANKASIYKFPNPNLTWEKTSSFNMGVDFSFFGGRVRGTFSGFVKKTRDAFLKKKISVINGVREYIVNQGTLDNRGMELGFSCYILSAASKNGFSWRIDPQIGRVVNKLVDENANQVLHNDYTYQDYIDGEVQVVGRPLNSFFSYEFTGLNPADGRPTFARIDEEHWEEYAGMLKEDVFQTVMNYSGCRVPYIQGAVGNTFSFKNFALSCNFTYSIGAKVRLLRLYSDVNNVLPQPVENLRREFLDRWQRPGDEKYTNVPGLLTNSQFAETISNSGVWWRGESYKFAENIWQMYNDSDIRVVSGDYLKLQQLSLRYSLPENWCEKIQLSSLQLSLTALHLATWGHKALRGQDPNTQTGASSNINVPIRPSYSFSLSVTF